LCLLIYGIIGTLAFLSWEGRREAKAIVALAEKYQQTHGRPPDCDCDLGIDEHHAFYKKKSDFRYIVFYFGAVVVTRYDSSAGQWVTVYWWTPNKFHDLAR